LAKIQSDTDNSQHIIVKFSHKYNLEAHRICANQGYAPKLIAVNDVGDWKMVMMEYIDGDILQGKPDDNIFNDIQTTIQLLHDKDIVFGDLRMCNVIKKEC